MPQLMDKNQKGYTLVEALIYIGITTIILSTISALLGASMTTRIKNSVIQEVELQGTLISQHISNSLRNSDSITLPLAGDTGGTLGLNLLNADTKTYSATGSNVRVTTNSGTPALLNSDKVTISGLTFRNLSQTGSRGTVHFEFTVTHLNPEGRNEFDYTKTFYGSGSLYDLN